MRDVQRSLWIGAACLSSILPGPAHAQTAAAPGDVLRAIDDPHLGIRWLLVRDADRPQGPARLVRAETGPDPISTNPASTDPAAKDPAARSSAPAQPRPVIRPGDRVIVEEDSPILSARFEAIALGLARAGARVNVRLTAGGAVLRVVALAPGRAALPPETEVQP